MKEENISVILKPLIETGIYKNEEVALKDIIATHIENKVNKYEETINKLEKKYNMKFKDLTKEIQNEADFEQEEDWMELKGAIVMKEAWEKARKKIIHDEGNIVSGSRLEGDAEKDLKKVLSVIPRYL